MKIKKYLAQDMRQAIRDIREEQGPDAVILSTRKVEGGIEIIAAVDYDETIFSDMTAGSSQGTAPSQASTSSPVSRSPQGSAQGSVHGSVQGSAQSSIQTSAKKGGSAREDSPVSSAPRGKPGMQSGAASGARAKRPSSSGAEWMQDPAMLEMKSEISTLRGILENRLTHLAWSDMARSQPERAGILYRLAEMGLTEELSQKVAAQVEVGDDNIEQAWRQALSILSHQVLVSEDDILSRGGVVALVGPTGVGKTTTIAKLAARFALRYGKHEVALISSDTYRIGAHDQLMTFGRILGVPTYAVQGQEDLIKIINELGDKRLVLIDTAGIGQRDIHLAERLSRLKTDSASIRSYLVMSANTQKETLDEVVRAFQRIPLAGCIMTKLDEASSLGGILSAAIQHHLPVSYISDGQKVPEDIYPARAHSLVSRAVALMRPEGQGFGSESTSVESNMGRIHA